MPAFKDARALLSEELEGDEWLALVDAIEAITEPPENGDEELLVRGDALNTMEASIAGNVQPQEFVWPVFQRYTFFPSFVANHTGTNTRLMTLSHNQDGPDGLSVINPWTMYAGSNFEHDYEFYWRYLV